MGDPNPKYSDRAEDCVERNNSKFKKVVRKNAMKKSNLILSNYSEGMTPLKEVVVRTFTNQNVTTKNSIENISRTNQENCNIFVPKENQLMEKDNNNESDNKETEIVQPINLIKFEQFFQCIEMPNTNRNAIGKSSSFTEMPNLISQDLPHKSNSFRTLAD